MSLIEVTKSMEVAAVRIEGRASSGEADKIKTALGEIELQGITRLRLDITSAAKPDLTFFQIIHSYAVYLESKGVSITVTDSGDGAFSEMLEQCGIGIPSWLKVEGQNEYS